MITISIWALVALCLVPVVLVALLWAVWNNWFPPADRGAFIYGFPSEVELNRTMDILSTGLGFSPRFFTANSYVRRVMYGNGVIFNLPSAQALEDVHGRTSALAFVVSSPRSEALKIRDLLSQRNWQGVVVTHDPDPDVPKGSMSFVTWDDCPFALVLRKPFNKMGPMPKRLR
ncbi:hypothetical protein BH11PAT4_BH11PAT4_8230 [soil metagenome]